ncbi:MAG: tetraacyldisaccharide 4'-kinase [Gemmatimonadaceae bacterium]
MHLIDRIWRGNDALSRSARVALTPFEVAYRAVTATRGWMYDHSLLRVRPSAVPVVSVGNLSVGGTGKTPFAAWLAAELAKRGAEPAVVLRGYGGDEARVHARLNPEIPVVIEPQRAEGIRRAAANGATVAVLDDAFQHRAAGRAVDVVLISAEQWRATPRLLPAGPWREPFRALRRASIAVITRKTADDATVGELAKTIRDAAPQLPQAVVHFTLDELRLASGTAASNVSPLAELARKSVVAIAGIADADAFFRQIAEAGGQVEPHPFPDHHRYTTGDIADIVLRPRGDDIVFVCTLKDAVKLGVLWPATAPPLWYVSQALKVESGEEAIEKLLTELAPNSTEGS